MESDVIKRLAVARGIDEAIIECLKLIPGVGILIEGIRKYHESIEEQQREKFTSNIVDRIVVLENKLTDPWYTSTEGKEFIPKLVATALNAEYNEKVEYFANALFNCIDYSQMERYRFIEILKKVSMPSLVILAHAHTLFSKGGRSPEILTKEMSKLTGFDPYLVDTCISELYSEGVFSSRIGYGGPGDQELSFSQGTPAYTILTKKFVEFIQNPRDLF